MISLIRMVGEIFKKPKNLLFGSVIYLSFAHHFIDIWARPALTIIILFALGTLIFVFIIDFLARKISPYLTKIEQKRFYLFILVSALVSLFIAWRIYKVPDSYQSLTIEPLVTGGQTVELIEVKANSVIVDVAKIAKDNGWDENNGYLVASHSSRPITVSFVSTANTPVYILFQSSPDSSKVRFFLGNQTDEANLYSTVDNEMLFEMQSRYRNLPNWLFLPALFIMDVIALGMMTMFLLLMQELGQKEAQQKTENIASIGHNKHILILLLFGSVLHLLNMLAVPLFLGPDSPSFLQGSVYLLEHGNFDGVSMFRGPGTTFLFAPVLYFFGRNSWAIKILLHLMALLCIPVSYRIGWQLSRNWQVAFISGLIAMLSPDLLFYSNYIMSDVPNILVVLIFISLLISALADEKWYWIPFTMLIGSFATLLRSENIVLLILGLVVLVAAAIWQWVNSGVERKRRIVRIGLAFIVALLPLFWWSAHNNRVHGFWGMSNYQGEVFYDGWVYSGDANRLSFSDRSSPAVQTINEVLKKYPAVITDKSGVPTGWEIYPSLLDAGYSTDQAFDLMASAAWDSIIHDKKKAVRLLFIKYKAGLKPEITHNITYPLPDEQPIKDEMKAEFFDEDTLVIPFLITLQRQINESTIQWYPRIYPTWVLFCIFTVFISWLRLPLEKWTTLTIITATRIFIPLTIGVAFWRYSLAGWIPAQIIAVSWIWGFIYGIKNILLDSTVSNPNSTYR